MIWSLQAALTSAAVAILVVIGLYLSLSPGRREHLRRLRSFVTLLQVADPQIRIDTLEKVHALAARDRGRIAGLLRRQLAAPSRPGRPGPARPGGASPTPPQQLMTVWFIRQILALLSDSRTAVRADAARALRTLLARETSRPESDKPARPGDDAPVAHAVAAAVELAGGRALSVSNEARQRTRVLAFAEMLEAGLRPLALSVQAIGSVTEEALEPLTSALRDRSPRVRRTLCEVLAAMGGERAVELLIPLLQDPSPEIRARAAQSLGGLKAGAAAPQLTQLLRDPLGEVRASAASALAEIELTSACSPIIAALSEECRRDDPAEQARAAFIEAISRLADGGRAELTEALVSLPRPVAARLAAALEGVGAIPRWLAEPENAAREELLSALLAAASQFGVSRPFLEALDDSEEHIRLRAAAALAHSHSPAALSAVAALLNDPDAAVRSQAARSLATLAHPLALQPLAQAAADPDPAVRLAAVAGIRQVIARREAWRADLLPADLDVNAALADAQHAVLLAAGDAEADIRGQAAQALPSFTAVEAVEALVNLALSDSDQAVMRTATDGLAAAASPHPQRRDRAASIRRLVASALEDQDDSRRARAITVLGAMGGPDAGRYLVEALHDPAGKVMEAALAALATADVGAPAGPSGSLCGKLIPELRHPDARVRAGVAAQLGRAPAAEAVEPLVQALADPDEEVRVSALSALSHMGRMARKHQSALTARLTDPSPRVRAGATAALSALRLGWAETTEAAQLFPEGPLSPTGAAALVDMAAEGDLKPFLWALNNAESGQSLASYLAGPGAEKLEALLSSLRQASEWDRVRAIAALSEAFRQTTAADSCLAQLKAINPAVRLTAVEIAGMLGTPEAVAALAEVLERDPVPEVRSRAATALAASRADAARTALHRAHAQDPNEVVRVVAARALERRQDVSQEPAELRSAADDAVPFPSDLEEQSKINWAERTPNPTE